ncbi:MAG TPA: division/cell wall cluster transcriptional repressor MraZ [Anaerolineales bacterium]|nr:division/cell wall cluster transcriptional repressor MraZ [Anaerolineales bacterium]
MFLGKYARTLDVKNRITVPPAFQTELTGGAYMTQGFDRNLQVLTAGAFKQLYHQAASLNVADPLARLMLRLFLGSATELPAGKSTLMIPDSLRAYAGLEGNVLLIGQGDYFEIWSPEEWRQQESQLQDAATNASRFATLELGTR